MQVEVRYFAIFREAAGTAAEYIETTSSTTAELYREMIARHPGMRHEAAALVAVNDEMSDWDAPIKDGDVVLFFPPVAGG